MFRHYYADHQPGQVASVFGTAFSRGKEPDVRAGWVDEQRGGNRQAFEAMRARCEIAVPKGSP
jgi:hypothetical protein